MVLYYLYYPVLGDYETKIVNLFGTDSFMTHLGFQIICMQNMVLIGQ